MLYANQKPRVSIIMGAYNVSAIPVFEAAIESVLHQTMEEFELIICDDGSTDQTWETLNKFAKRDARIKLLQNMENKGLAATLNHCLKYVRGDLIARQDADDFSRLDRLQKQAEFLELHPEVGFVGSNVKLWDEKGVWGERIFPTYPQPEDFLYTMPFVHGALMFRKDALMVVNGYRVAKETRRAEDYDMLMRMYSQGIRGANLSEFLYEFCENHATQKRRKYCYRIDEAVVRWKGFWGLGLMPKGIAYVVKPLIAGMLPASVLREIKKYRNY